ncbi:hypothetical protein [Psychrobium sp. 1_MG-2023]|uniref:hypothetical protein n=1 Tax=Psychrobium sp. 1_MG-2023 TaxID=3062624 RepID=UPI000C34B79A|nr:hypothetical protein [Psychrobium sp. 1_MG-2023]MDP2561623.1 hypothetical protein [Psychrobium sp. 1_MG-2023]PKF55642.1 hypothetical protein CW748_12345 [Alteromonadales bacterium alter-6D02]
MSTLKLFIIAAITFVSTLFAQGYIESATELRAYQGSRDFANLEKPYQFKVPKDGQMMRFEIRGTMPLNDWKAMELSVFDGQGKYLFTYQDDLWAESGYDSDGYWTEYKRKASLEQRFPKQGTYSILLSDSASTHKSTAGHTYTIRAVPIRGDGSVLTSIKWISGIIAALSLFLLFFILDRKNEKKKSKLYNMNHRRIKQEKPNKSYKGLVILILIFYVPLTAASLIALQDDDDDIDWVSVSYRSPHIVVDRDMRQQSMSGSYFRTGGSRGGK